MWLFVEIDIGCRLKLDASLSASTSCATLFISCAPLPRLTTTGWAARAPSPPLCSNRTAPPPSSTPARVDDRAAAVRFERSEEHTSEPPSRPNLLSRLLL